MIYKLFFHSDKITQVLRTEFRQKIVTFRKTQAEKKIELKNPITQIEKLKESIASGINK